MKMKQKKKRIDPVRLKEQRERGKELTVVLFESMMMMIVKMNYLIEGNN